MPLAVEPASIASVADIDLRDPIEAGFHSDDHSVLKDAYDRYGALVYTLSRKALGVDEAADITQEVFLAAWNRRHQFDPERGSLGAWLVGIAKNKIIDTARKKDRREKLEMTIEAQQARSPKFVDALADRLLLDDALQFLPSRNRKVMEMAFYEELSQTEIATRLKMPLGTVKSDMRRGLAQLRRHLLAVDEFEATT